MVHMPLNWNYSTAWCVLLFMINSVVQEQVRSRSLHGRNAVLYDGKLLAASGVGLRNRGQVNKPMLSYSRLRKVGTWAKAEFF